MRVHVGDQKGTVHDMMQDQNVQAFVVSTAHQVTTFPSEIIPAILSSILLTVAVNCTEDPKAAIRQLAEHTIEIVDEAVERRAAILETRGNA
jgi:hypothetical protein